MEIVTAKKMEQLVQSSSDTGQQAVAEIQTGISKTCRIGSRAADTLYKKLESYWPFLAKNVYLDGDDYRPDFLAICADMTKSEVKRIFGHLEELAGEWPLGIARLKQLASKPTMLEISTARKTILDRAVKTEDLHPVFYYARTSYSWEMQHAQESKIDALIEKILAEAYRREKSEPGSISAIKKRAEIADLEREQLENQRIYELNLSRGLIAEKKPTSAVAVRAMEILEKINKNREATNVK